MCADSEAIAVRMCETVIYQKHRNINMAIIIKSADKVFVCIINEKGIISISLGLNT